MTRRPFVRFALAAVAAVATDHALLAQAPSQPASGKPATAAARAAPEHHAPPPEAVAACKGRQLEQDCAFASPAGTKKGTCVQADAAGPLACRPTRHGAPPEALAACKGRKANDACTLKSPAGTEAGVCVAADDKGVLGCRPPRR